MAYKFRRVQNKIDGSPIYDKWYARGVTLGNVSTEALCDEISHSTTVTESDVRAVFAELKVKLRDHLKNNQSVKVDGLGTFFVRLKSIPTDTAEECTAEKIKGCSVGFLPEGATVPQGILDAKGKMQKVRYKKLLEGISFELFDYTANKKKAEEGKTDSGSTDTGGTGDTGSETNG